MVSKWLFSMACLVRQFKNADPTLIGVVVTVVLGTIKDSIMVAAGKMSAKEMGMNFVDTLVISSGYVVSMKVGGLIAQALCPQLPGIGYATEVCWGAPWLLFII